MLPDLACVCCLAFKERSNNWKYLFKIWKYKHKNRLTEKYFFEGMLKMTMENEEKKRSNKKG